MWHKGTSVYISYCQLQQVTHPHCNMLDSYQQHTAAIYIYVYISVCVMWNKGTSLHITYCQLQQVTKPQCNILHSYQQQREAIYLYIFVCVSVCVMWKKGTSVYISYCQLQQVTQPQCNILHSYQQHTASIYISLSVSCDTKEHQYTFRTASYSRSHSHTAICYIVLSNIQQLYIYHFLCHVTQRNISIHFVLPATAGHTATLQYVT